MTTNEQQTTERIFVGIKVSPEIASILLDMQKELQGLPVRLVHPQNMHVTVVPPWGSRDWKMDAEKIRSALLNADARSQMVFDRVSYGPTAQCPRLVWASGPASQDLFGLKKVLTNALELAIDRPDFVPHVTIARFAEEDRKAFLSHPLDRKLAISMPVHTVELLLSPRGGGDYQILESFPILGKDGPSTTHV